MEPRPGRPRSVLPYCPRHWSQWSWEQMVISTSIHLGEHGVHGYRSVDIAPHPRLSALQDQATLSLWSEDQTTAYIRRRSLPHQAPFLALGSRAQAVLRLTSPSAQ